MNKHIFLFFLIFISLKVSAQKQFADYVLYNGKVWTGLDEPAFTSAVAIKGNKILRIGSSASMLKLANHLTKKIDLKGKLVTAGINDAHIHFLSGALGLSEIDLNDCSTEEQAIEIIKKYVKENPTKTWITGMGWQYKIFANSMPSKKTLDAIESTRPIFISAYDGHSCWVNSKALEMAGINKESNFEGFGAIIKDEDGNPTGALTEEAQDLISKLIPQPNHHDNIKALKQGMQYAASLGITSIQNASGSLEEFALYQELLHKGELKIRSSTAFSASNNTSEKDIQQYVSLRNKMKNNPYLKAGSIKFVMDGVIESHTAVMRRPYSDTLSNKIANGNLALDPIKYKHLVDRFDELGFQIYTHAIGDSAVRQVLDAYEHAKILNKTENRRHRVEHIEQSLPEDVTRFAKLNVIASMEPIHADPGTVAVWSKAVGNERLPYSFVWHSMLKNNVKLVFSSDWPACFTPNPIRGIHNAVNRRTIEGLPEGGWIPEQKISIKDAMIAYTQGGAYSSFEENVKGKILPGYYADLIVLSQDLFSIPSMDIYKTKVIYTFFDGKMMYETK